MEAWKGKKLSQLSRSVREGSPGKTVTVRAYDLQGRSFVLQRLGRARSLTSKTTLQVIRPDGDGFGPANFPYRPGKLRQPSSPSTLPWRSRITGLI